MAHRACAGRSALRPAAAVRRLGKAETAYRKVTFHKEHLDQDQHLDAVLIGPGHPLYAAVDERLNEQLRGSAGSVAVYLDETATAPYRLHFFEVTLRGQTPAMSRRPCMASWWRCARRSIGRRLHRTALA